MRHVGDEGGPQRRAQPVDPRRLVGRVVRRRQRLGDPVGRRRRRPRPPRRHRGRGAVRPARGRGRPALLRRRRRQAAQRAGSRWSGTRSSRSAPRCWRRAWCADYVRQLYTPAADRVAPRHPTTTQAVGRPRVLEGEGARGVAAACGSSTSSRAASATRRPSGQTSRCGCSRRSGELDPDDVDVQVVHGRVAGDDQLREPSVASLAHAESYEAGRHRFEADIALDHTGPFGYTVRILPEERPAGVVGRARRRRLAARRQRPRHCCELKSAWSRPVRPTASKSASVPVEQAHDRTRLVPRRVVLRRPGARRRCAPPAGSGRPTRPAAPRRPARCRRAARARTTCRGGGCPGRRPRAAGRRPRRCRACCCRVEPGVLGHLRAVRL